ncbi:hypothetical protein [Streptomyces sp. ISL-96]|uniref:hypothetical protein n=1 Tax=Streptomyces sp. ISL-96 TaxID=2819191 RepID=UPI0035AB87F8
MRRPLTVAAADAVFTAVSLPGTTAQAAGPAPAVSADRLGAGGSFPELQALNFRDGGPGRTRDGKYRLIASEGKVVGGPLLKTGNTTSRVEFGCDPGERTDAWSASGVAHHWALARGGLLPDLRALAGLTGLELVEVSA